APQGILVRLSFSTDCCTLERRGVARGLTWGAPLTRPFWWAVRTGYAALIVSCKKNWTDAERSARAPRSPPGRAEPSQDKKRRSAGNLTPVGQKKWRGRAATSRWALARTKNADWRETLHQSVKKNDGAAQQHPAGPCQDKKRGSTG